MSPKSSNVYPLAVHVLLFDGHDVLFAQRAGTGYADGQWSVPAGHVERGESASAAAVRECSEELGVEVDPADLALVLTQHKMDPIDGEERVDLFFRASRFVGRPRNREPHKCARLTWAEPGDMTALVGYVEHALDRIADGAAYAEFGWQRE
ncbi:NUDIX hydrolase [Glycomyces tarimensis]